MSPTRFTKFFAPGVKSLYTLAFLFLHPFAFLSSFKQLHHVISDRYSYYDYHQAKWTCWTDNVAKLAVRYLQRRDIENAPLATLSSDVESVIDQMKRSEHYKPEMSEASVRVLDELIIFDRLDHLSDKRVLQHLELHSMLDVDFERGDGQV